MVINLQFPATLGERTIESITLKRPQTGDFLRTNGHDIDSIGADIALVSALSGEPEELIKKIDIDDWALIRVELKKIWFAYFGIKPEEPKNPT